MASDISIWERIGFRRSSGVAEAGWGHTLIVAAISFIYFLPVLFIIFTAIKPQELALSVPPTLSPTSLFGLLIPDQFVFTPTLENFGSVFSRVMMAGGQPELTGFDRFFFNSIVIASVSVLLALILGTLAAFGFSRYPLRGNDTYLFIILTTRMLPAIVVVIPVILMFRAAGLSGSYLGIILLYTAFNLAFTIWMIKSFFDELSSDVEIFARIDGSSEIKVFLKICLTQVVAGLAATFVFGLILTWNEFLFALLLTGPDTRTVPVAMNQAVSSGGRGTDWTLLAAIETLFLIPVFLVTFFLQEHLLRGVTFGTIQEVAMSTIEVRKITKRFGEFVAVRDVDLSVAAGEVVCLLGPSGCGKTTTLRMIAGLERATAGDVVIAGRRMNDLRPEKRNIAMVFQFYALYPALTVGQNIAMPLHHERIGQAEIAARVDKVADILHLRDVLDRLPGQVSEGEKQRVAVARAIVRDPNCFLFDEPLSRLDVELRHAMRGQIKAVLSNLSKATVIVTHDQLEALTMADRIAIMREGLIEQDGTPHEVFARPANIFVASFIGTPQMNLIDAELERFGNGKATVTFDKQDVDLGVNSAVAGLKPGRITVGVRPRAFTVVPEHTADTIAAMAELIEPMGAETLIHARTRTGSDIRVVIHEKRVKVGEALHLVPDPAQTHVFAEDGRAVRA